MWRSGKAADQFCLSDTHLLHRYFFVTKYIAYDEISRVYLRIESGEYGDLPLAEYSLVIVNTSGEESALHAERKDGAERVIGLLQERCPQIAVGKKA